MSISRWTDKDNVVHVYNGIYSAIKKNEITSFAATWIVVVQSLSRVRLFATPWTAVREASLSITSSQSLLKLMSIKSVCHPTISSSVSPFSSCSQSFPASEYFLMSQLFASGGQSIEASASALPMNIQDWFPLGLTGLISLLSKGLSIVFSGNTTWKHQFFGT